MSAEISWDLTAVLAASSAAAAPSASAAAVAEAGPAPGSARRPSRKDPSPSQHRAGAVTSWP